MDLLGQGQILSSDKARRHKFSKMLIQSLSGTNCIKIILEIVILVLVIGSKTVWDKKSD